MAIMVSVCMLTFNHEKWIEQAINGVLIQKTDFPIELIIGEDCSTDNTADVVRKMAEQHPEIIKPFYNKGNLGLAGNFTQTLNQCNGKYIAICEGDDFWTDPLKLKKQVNFLESNYDFIMCSHNCKRLYERNGSLEQNDKYHDNFSYDQEKFLMDWVTQPLTCIFRNFFRDYTYFNKENIFCDVTFFYEILKHGKGYFMADNMATFRVLESALSSGLSRQQWDINHVIMFDHLYKYNRRDALVQELSRKYCLKLFIYHLRNRERITGDFRPLKEALKRTPGTIDKLLIIMFNIPYYIIRHGLFFRIFPKIIS